MKIGGTTFPFTVVPGSLTPVPSVMVVVVQFVKDQYLPGLVATHRDSVTVPDELTAMVTRVGPGFDATVSTLL